MASLPLRSRNRLLCGGTLPRGARLSAMQLLLQRPCRVLCRVCMLRVLVGARLRELGHRRPCRRRLGLRGRDFPMLGRELREE